MDQLTMKAANLHGIGDLRYEEVPVPSCGEDEVLIAVHYCGICGSDIDRVLRKGTYHFPTIPGHEFAGIIAYDPKGELTGRKASIFPLIPCGKCEMCHQGLYHLCDDYDYYGSRRDGAFAQYLAVKRWNLVLLPDELSLEEAALCEPVAVAHHAVSQLGVQPGDTMLISGAGPIGLLVAFWAREKGARKICFFDIMPEKIAYAKELGFDEYDGQELMDVVVEGTGYDDALTRCLEAVRPRGHLLLMGNPARDMALSRETYWRILRKEITISGTWNSAYFGEKHDWHAAVEAMASGRLPVRKVISHVFPLCEHKEAFAALTNREVFTNRVLLKTFE